MPKQHSSAYSIKATRFCAIGIVVFLLVQHQSQALVHYAGNNEKNTVLPSHSSLPFDSVARICSKNGRETSGTAVYIKKRYLLTANHVKILSHVTFDGNTYYKLDPSFQPTQVANADLKLIRLLKTPELSPVALFDKPLGDTKVNAWIVGWGVGIDQQLESYDNKDHLRIWKWGDQATIRKRWGTNYVLGYRTWHKDIQSPLVTMLDASSGVDEAGLTMYDSGAALFVRNDDLWKLAGIGTRARHDLSKFSTNYNHAGRNYYVRVYYHHEAIEAFIQACKHTEATQVSNGSSPDSSDTVYLSLSTGALLLLFWLAMKSRAQPN